MGGGASYGTRSSSSAAAPASGEQREAPVEADTFARQRFSVPERGVLCGATSPVGNTGHMCHVRDWVQGGHLRGRFMCPPALGAGIQYHVHATPSTVNAWWKDHIAVLDRCQAPYSEEKSTTMGSKSTAGVDSTAAFRGVWRRNNIFQVGHWGVQRLAEWGIHKSNPTLCAHDVQAIHMSDVYAPPTAQPHTNGTVSETIAGRGSIRPAPALTTLPVRDQARPRTQRKDSGLDNADAGSGADATTPTTEPQIEIHFGVRDVQFAKPDAHPDDETWSVTYEVPTRNGAHHERVDCTPDLVILAEGSRRNILINQLRQQPVIASPKQEFLYAFLTPDASRAVGPHCYFARQADHENYARGKGHSLVKRALIGRPDKGRAIIFMQSDGWSGPGSDDTERSAAISTLAEHSLRAAFPALKDISLTPDPATPLVTFRVQETHSPRYVLGNVVVVGDAARTGHFSSAVGISHALVSDINALTLLVEAIVQHRPSADPEAVGVVNANIRAARVACETAMRHITSVYHESDLHWFYERL
ncbi:hypothetical protein DFJ77DRAFT_441639 [Powellomyces hirtus]|nr:hypothetical protein DFJ77DRAFT_441639 [Powellomyces hirtus]